MCATEPKAKDKSKEERPESTGKVYQQLVEDLFMGSSEDGEDDEEDSPDTE